VGAVSNRDPLRVDPVAAVPGGSVFAILSLNGPRPAGERVRLAARGGFGSFLHRTACSHQSIALLQDVVRLNVSAISIPEFLDMSKLDRSRRIHTLSSDWPTDIKVLGGMQ
jgi:hypothetical protein